MIPKHIQKERAGFIQQFSYKQDECYAKEVLQDVMQSLPVAHQNNCHRLVIFTDAPPRAIAILKSKIDFNSLSLLSVKQIDILPIETKEQETQNMRFSHVPTLCVESIVNPKTIFEA